MSSLRKSNGLCNRIVKSLSTASGGRAMSLAMTIAVLIIFCVCSANVSFATITYTTQSCPASGQLLPGGSATTDLLINTPCTVVGRFPAHRSVRIP